MRGFVAETDPTLRVLRVPIVEHVLHRQICQAERSRSRGLVAEDLGDNT